MDTRNHPSVQLHWLHYALLKPKKTKRLRKKKRRLEKTHIVMKHQVLPVVLISVGRDSAVVTHKSVLAPISATFKQNAIAVKKYTDSPADADKERSNEKIPPPKKNKA